MTPPENIANEMLLANAGSGKTYALTTRIIQLLLLGVEADKIAALTFTRKSAGEFLDQLLERIAKAAEDPKKLAALAEDTEVETLSAEDCRRLLAHIVHHFGRLGLGTIDSFFARMARQFPLETGLPEDFAIADGAALESARERALAACFSASTGNDAALQAMIDQLRLITRRNGERNVFQTLLSQIGNLHQRYCETPKGIRWGNAKAIWGRTGAPFSNAGEVAPAVENFRRTVKETHPDLSPEAAEILEGELAAVEGFVAGRPWSKAVKDFVEKRLCSEPKSGNLQITRKKTGRLELNEAVRTARADLLATLLKDEFSALLERSGGIHDFMAGYESVYEEQVRGAGLVTFSDITDLLARRASETEDFETADAWRRRVAYRLDQKFDHWLLDEFQDTSRTQWSILCTFIEEVLMDDSGTRSFFYVGDTKQAIYGWRGGDSDLFHEIHKHYNGGIEEADPLAASWRSSPPIIEMVNTIFDSVGQLADTLQLPRATVEKWQAGWNAHSVATENRDRPGYAAWHTVEKDPDAAIDPQFLEIREILAQVDPISRGIDCAILLRKNNEVAELAAYLQSEGIPVAVEGKSNPCVDNPLGTALLAALRNAAHPDDTLSLAIARGFPSATAWGLDEPETFRQNALQSIAENGYAPTLRSWIDAATLDPEESFLVARAEAIVAAAEIFDEQRTTREGIGQFIDYVESLQLQEAEAADALRLMTVHQAKGLGFEMVIVAGLDKSGSGSGTNALVLGPDKRDPQWGTLLPTKDIAKQDPELKAQGEQLDAESRYNDLCTAYVALTRPKYGLYVLSQALGEKSSAKHFGKHLQATLDPDWKSGNPEWFLTDFR